MTEFSKNFNKELKEYGTYGAHFSTYTENSQDSSRVLFEWKTKLFQTFSLM